MRLNKKFGHLIIGFIYMALPVLAKDDLLIRVCLLRSENSASEKLPHQIEILSAATHPELASLTEKALASESTLVSAASEALMDIYDLDGVDAFFRHDKTWSGLRPVLLDDFIKGENLFYRVKLYPKPLANKQIALKMTISSGKNTLAAADTYIDHEIVLNLHEPAIIVAPYSGYTYFALVVIKNNAPDKIDAGPMKTAQTEIVAAPRAVHLVRPFYPEKLRRRGVGGAINLLVKIDKDGKVLAAAVERPVHPYLDYAAVQALLKSTFEPVILKEKPAPAAFFLAYNFHPSDYTPDVAPHSPWTEASAYSPDTSNKILFECGEYCKKLATAAMDFVCQEKISDTHFSLRQNLRWGYHTIVAGKEREYPTVVQRIPYQIMDPTKTKRNNYLCDYQIIRKGGAYNERRILLKENGRSYSDPNKLLEESRITSLSPLFAPLRILLPEQQEKFFFRISGEESVHGRKLYIVEASPKSGDEDGIWAARIWVDKERCLVLKCEIEGIPVDGYEDILEDCTKMNIRPDFTTIHEYKLEKEGILFPWRSKVVVGYPDISPEASIPKNDIALSYDHYRFFTVSSEHRIIN